MAYVRSHDYFSYINSLVFFIYSLFLSDEGPMLETLDYTIRIGSIPTFLYFDLYLYSAYAAHFVYFSDLMKDTSDLMTDRSDLMKGTSDLMKDTSDLMTDTSDLMKGTSDLMKDTSDLMKDTSDLMKDTSDLMKDTSDLIAPYCFLKSGKNASFNFKKCSWIFWKRMEKIVLKTKKHDF